MRPQRYWLLLGSLIVGSGLLVAACGSDAPPTTPTPTPATFVRVDIEGPPQQNMGAPGDTLQLRAVATFSDGSRPDVTSEAAWSVTDPRVLAVSSRGLVTGVAVGGTIVSARYRDRTGDVNVSVGPIGGPSFGVTGVVLDSERGTPVGDAEVTENLYSDEDWVVARTDSNGFFNLGDRRGQVIFKVRQFGYQDADVRLDAVKVPTRVDVRLAPNPGAFIERTASGRFAPPPPHYDESHARLRLTTRAGGVFDAMVRSTNCAGSPALRILAESGGTLIAGRWGPCTARLRFVVPAPDVELTLSGINVTDWVLTYREPR